MQISALDYNSYVGVIGVGRISARRAEAQTSRWR
jgi:predicted membrane GTPase involved in stress response